MKRHKYMAKRTDGFSSKLEAEMFKLLKAREAAGEISDIEQQIVVVLQDGCKKTKITWRIDFAFFVTAKGERELLEAKGMETADYKLKLKLFRKQRPYSLEIWKGKYTTRNNVPVCIPYLVERVEAI